MAGPHREELPRCQCEYHSDPEEWMKCGRPTVAKWTFPPDVVIFCCEECDEEYQDGVFPPTREPLTEAERAAEASDWE